jgi:hypothetical protein
MRPYQAKAADYYRFRDTADPFERQTGGTNRSRIGIR